MGELTRMFLLVACGFAPNSFVFTRVMAAKGDARDRPYDLRLEFSKPVVDGDDEVPETFTKEIVVGSAPRQDGKESSAGSFELKFPEEVTKTGWFSADQMKGSVAAGSTQKVSPAHHHRRLRVWGYRGVLSVSAIHTCFNRDTRVISKRSFCHPCPPRIRLPLPLDCFFF